MQNVDKAEWLKAIGAKEFPEPVKYAYTFPGYSGAFNLSERYVEESDLKELKAQYEKNKAHALEVIKAKKRVGYALLRCWTLLKSPFFSKYKSISESSERGMPR